MRSDELMNKANKKKHESLDIIALLVDRIKD